MHASNAATDRLDCPLVSTRRVVLSLIDAFAHYCLRIQTVSSLSDIRVVRPWPWPDLKAGNFGLGLDGPGLGLGTQALALQRYKAKVD